MKENQKKLLIVERSSVDLKISDTGKYILEGVFTEFGVKNKNNRIYESSEFLPHLKELQEKISKNKLVGELDHPKDFEISLSRASHIVQDLTYDKDRDCVTGKVRLTSTTAGKDAKALVDDGVPLHISSRAAGTVGSNGKVKIQKLFTYDLVADPGFANAELNRVNEKYGFPLNENLSVYEVDDKGEIMDQKEDENDDLAEKTKVAKYIQKKQEPTMENFINRQDFENYSNYVKQEISQLKEMIVNKNDYHETNESVESTEKLDKLISYSNHIAESVNKLHSYVNYLSENLDNSISHSDYIVEQLSSIKEYTNYLGENLGSSISYMNYLAENVDNNIQYSEYLGENLNNNIKYSEYIGENLNKSINYGDYLAEKINESHTELDGKQNKLEEYAGYLAENLDKNIQYSEYIAENSGNSIEYSEYLKENIERLIKYNNYVSENINKVIENVNESKTGIEKTSINENSNFQDRINKNLEEIVESAKKQKVGNSNPELHFLNFLNESKRNEFNSLDKTKQEKLIESYKRNRYFSTIDAENIWNSTLNENVSLNFIDNMPASYKKSWENLSESSKNAIIAQSKYHTLNTQYQINNFWQTRDLRESKMLLEKINESKKISNNSESSSAVNENLDSIKNAIKNRFSRLS